MLTLTHVGQSAFAGCISLSTITIPTSITTIGNNAFNNSGLTTVTVTDTVTILGNPFNSLKH